VLHFTSCIAVRLVERRSGNMFYRSLRAIDA
jgi:hypothetical protein